MSEPVRRAAVLGSPIAHSLSPRLHRAAYAALGLDWSYDAIEVDEAGLPAFLAGLDESWAGLSLTMPLKSAVIGLLDDVDPTARAVGAVNTVLPSADGGWHGTNTDVPGMVGALIEAGTATGPSAAARATVLGAGATARSGVAALARLGVTSVTICARRREQAAEVAELARVLGLQAEPAGLEADPTLMDVDFVVSTLPGSAGTDWAAVTSGARGTLLDAAYDPWPTPLAAAWPNPSVASGRDLLLWQAVDQVRLMTGRPAPVDAMRAALPERAVGI